MTESIHVKDIAELINSGKINFFVGAGISRDQVDLTFPKLLIETWTGELSDYYDMGRLRLETVMQILMSTFHDKSTVLNRLPKYLLSTEPNQNHYLLAHALHNGCTVFTTNFDLLIEIAYWNLYGSLPPILINEEDYGNNQGALIKIHGSIGTVTIENDTLVVEDARNTMIGALNQVARGLPEIKSIQIHSHMSLNDTIFWGYSCMDDFDIFPALSMIKKTGKNFIGHITQIRINMAFIWEISYTH